jgi:hypothetical protein
MDLVVSTKLFGGGRYLIMQIQRFSCALDAFRCIC